LESEHGFQKVFGTDASPSLDGNTYNEYVTAFHLKDILIWVLAQASITLSPNSDDEHRCSSSKT
jgi:hypothetical protein